MRDVVTANFIFLAEIIQSLQHRSPSRSLHHLSARSVLCSSNILTFNFLFPGHGSEPRNVSELPYKVQLSSQRVVSGEKVTVSLTGSGFLTSPELKGFLMQVCRSAEYPVRLVVLTIHHSSLTCSHINKTICNLRLFLLCLIVS